MEINTEAHPDSGDHGAAWLAGFLGWTLDAFDFFLVAYCLTAIGREFHKTDAEVAFSLTLTLAFRPVGAFLFGLLADRYGRRLPLMIDFVFYGVVEVATGFTRTYPSFLALRALFGVGMGGVWGVGSSLAMEKVPVRLRGILSGLLQQGYALGNILAGLSFLLLFDRFGWRPLFFLGGIPPILLALFVRFRVKESDVWERSKPSDWHTLGRTILAHWKLFVYLTLFMTTMNLASHGTQDMFPAFLERQWHLHTQTRSWISILSMVGAIAGGVLTGLYSDRHGRRRAIITALLLAVLIVPLWAYAPTVGLLALGAFLIQFCVQGAWGVIPAHLNELSPNAIRGFLPGFAYQCGVLLSSGVTTFEAKLAEHISYASAMASTAAVVFVVAAVAASFGGERRGREFAREG
jgi:MFS transporter, SHS family, lactate transporter